MSEFLLGTLAIEQLLGGGDDQNVNNCSTVTYADKMVDRIGSASMKPKIFLGALGCPDIINKAPKVACLGEK
ncbi:unnamed protein product [Dovyalis caffra]|uniref:Uncharacterized protein n=1 Tax=Dovyalis caffra TaxID=77055 RepID=A0AAV1QZA9_9ROSI|nr:unnamed protein product [Dovyalis caffra]